MTAATEHQADAQRDADARRKAVDTLRAQLALRSHELQELPDGTFLARRWGWPPRALADLDAVRAFTRLVGAA